MSRCLLVPSGLYQSGRQHHLDALCSSGGGFRAAGKVRSADEGENTSPRILAEPIANIHRLHEAVMCIDASTQSSGRVALYSLGALPSCLDDAREGL